MVELQHLRLFVRVSELNSFSETAIAVGLAQPSVSRIVKELETAWGGALFYRTGRGVTLSELGEAALPRARALINEADQLSHDLRARSGVPSGTVSLGVSPSLAPTLVPGLVNQLRSEAPGIRLRIHEGFSDQIERWRAGGEIDIGVWSNFREAGSDTGGEAALFTSNLVLVYPPGTGPVPAEIDFADLGAFPLAMPAAPNGLRTIFEDVARRKRMTLNITLETDSIIVQKQVCQNCGCHLIKSPETISEEIELGTYRTSVIVNPTVQRYLLLDTTRLRPTSRAAREVASRLTTMLRLLSPR